MRARLGTAAAVALVGAELALPVFALTILVDADRVALRSLYQNVFEDNATHRTHLRILELDVAAKRGADRRDVAKGDVAEVRIGRRPDNKAVALAYDRVLDKHILRRRLHANRVVTVLDIDAADVDTLCRDIQPICIRRVGIVG